MTSSCSYMIVLAARGSSSFSYTVCSLIWVPSPSLPSSMHWRSINTETSTRSSTQVTSENYFVQKSFLDKNIIRILFYASRIIHIIATLKRNAIFMNCLSLAALQQIVETTFPFQCVWTLSVQPVTEVSWILLFRSSALIQCPILGPYLLFVVLPEAFQLCEISPIWVCVLYICFFLFVMHQQVSHGWFVLGGLENIIGYLTLGF